MQGNLSVEDSYDITFDGLNKWYQHTIEKMGWMLTCIKYEKEKFDSYQYSLDRLHNVVQLKKKELNDPDRRRDMDVMILKIKKAKKIISLCNNAESQGLMIGGKKGAKSGSKKGSKNGSKKGVKSGSKKDAKSGSKKKY
jgi:hypothetical protein